MPLEQTTHLKELLPLVQPFAPRVVPIIAVFHLREAGIRFCRETRCWREIVVQPLPLTEQPIAVPDYATVHAIDSVRWQRHENRENTYTLSPIASIDVEQSGLSYRTGSPSCFSQTNPGSIAVYPVEENASGTIHINTFVHSKRDTKYGTAPDGSAVADMGPTDNYFDRVANHVAQNYGDFIAYGALATLMSLPETDVKDDQDSAYYERKFMRAINRVASKSLTGQQRAPVRARAQWF